MERSSIGKERCYFIGRVPGYPAAYGSDQEGEFGMGFCKSYEALYGLFCAIQTFHCGNGVGLALEALAVTPLRSEMVKCISGGTSCVMAVLVRAKDKDLSGLQGADMFWGYSLNHINW
jgi:hypothetical protein